MSKDPYMARTLRENIDPIADRVGAGSNPEIEEIKQDVSPEQVLDALEESGPRPRRPDAASRCVDVQRQQPPAPVANHQ